MIKRIEATSCKPAQAVVSEDGWDYALSACPSPEDLKFANEILDRIKTIGLLSKVTCPCDNQWWKWI